jgi:hypothetical protein
LQEIVMAMLQLLKTEKPTTPVARAIVVAAAAMSPGGPGARAVFEPYVAELLAVIDGARSIKQQSSLLLMNMATVGGCRREMMQNGAVPLLVNTLRIGLDEEDDLGSAHFSRLT